MENPLDTNASIWKSDQVVQQWVASGDERDRKRIAQWRFMAELLPFDEADEFTFLDLGAGTGAAARSILDLYPNCHAVLADYSPQMMQEGSRALHPYDGRFEYVEFDMLSGQWPTAIPTPLGAAVTSLCVHHLPDSRKRGLFGEIFERLAPGGWYLNFDPVTSDDPLVAAAWQRTNDRQDPVTAQRSNHRSSDEQARYENHVRYMIPLAPQLDFLREAGFGAVDVYWRQLDNVIYGGLRPE